MVDWIDVKIGAKHELDYLKTGDGFVDEVFLYPSKRIDGQHLDKKDIVSISYLTNEQLNDINYSDTYVRFKVKKLMEDHGIKGSKNGKNPNYPHASEQPHKYLSIKLENSKRRVIKPVSISFPKDNECIFAIDKSAEDIICSNFKKDDSYVYALNERIYMENLLIK